MKDLEWIEINGKRVLPVNAHPGRCSTSSVTKSFVKSPHIVCGLWDNCSQQCQEKGPGTFIMFIAEEQLPAYLALKLQGLAP